MRIISGKYRGMKLSEFQGSDIRPTADRVKENLFNIISSEVPGTSVLDLFCGSCGLGLECLSRGALFVHFNDISAESLCVLRKNLSRFNGENARVTNLDFRACLERLTEKFSLIFVGPPYRTEAGAGALEMIGAKGLLKESGIAVYERDRAFKGEAEGLELFDERKYGITYLSFFRAANRA